MANDTHGAGGAGWYGFDLDGTLAEYDKWSGIDSIGKPVGPMVKLIKKMHEEGKVVKILTARVAPRDEVEVKQNPYYGASVCLKSDEAVRWAEESGVLRQDVWAARDFIECWCAVNLGFVPEITHEKDHLMLELYDDRVKQVIPNTGVLIEDELARTRGSVADLIDCNQALSRIEAIGCGLIGCFIGVLLMAIVIFIHDSFVPTKAEAEAKLIEALREYRESAKPNFVRELFTGGEEQK